MSPSRKLEPKDHERIDRILAELHKDYDFKTIEVTYSIIKVGLKGGVTFRFHSRIANLIKEQYALINNPLYGIIKFVKKNNTHCNLIVDADDTESRFIAKLLTKIRNNFKEKRSARVEANKKMLKNVVKEIITQMPENIQKIITRVQVFKEKGGSRCYIVRVFVSESMFQFSGKTSSLHLLEQDIRGDLFAIITSTSIARKILSESSLPSRS